ISQRLIALMGGQLTVESEPGRGSTFSFTARFGRRDDAASPPYLANLGGLRVLVVEDNAASRRLFESWLRGWCVESAAFGDGNAALYALLHAAAAGRPFDVVLLDGGIPDAPVTLEARIAEHAEIAATRVVLLASGDRAGD